MTQTSVASARSSDFPPASVLIVEDETLLAIELECLVEDMGLEVAGVYGHLDAAFASIASNEFEADCAIIDVNLSGQSALPLEAHLIQRRIPYVITTGYMEAEVRRMGFAGQIVEKPLHIEALRSEIIRLVRGGMA